MLPFFSKKWENIQNWLKVTAIGAIRPPSKPGKSTYCILCVDDDPDFCNYLQRLAVTLEIDLDKAYSLEKAKQKINEKNYTAFIVDGHLPDGSGFELVAWIREKKNLSQPIGFLSRIYHDAASFRILKETFQVDLVLEKPISVQDVNTFLKQLCHIESFSPLDQLLEDDVLTDLKQNYHKSIFDKIERIEKLILKVQKSPTIETFQALKAEVHKIAGSSGSYGFPEVSLLCKEMEIELSQQIEAINAIRFDPNWMGSLDGFFTKIKSNFQITEENKRMDQKQEKDVLLPFLYAVTSDQTFINSKENLEKDQVIDILIESNPELALQKLSAIEFFPRFLLVHSHYAGNILTGEDLLYSFYQKEEEVEASSGFFSDLENFKEQAHLIKKGIPFVLISPLSIQIVKLLLESSLPRPIWEGYKILVIDDDPDIYNYILQALKITGAEIACLLNQSEIINKLNSDYPDIILLNINLSDKKGIQVLKILQEIHYKNLLIAMVTVTQEAHLIEKVYESNVDDILFKPLDQVTLQKRLSSSLKKLHHLPGKASENTLSPLLDAQAFSYYLQKKYLQNKRFLESHTLVVFEIYQFEELLKQAGNIIEKNFLNQINQSISDLFKKCEICAYLEKGRIALIFSGMDLYFARLFMVNFLKTLHFDMKKAFIVEAEISFNCVILPLVEAGQSQERIEQQVQRMLMQVKEPGNPINIVSVADQLMIGKPRKVLLIGDDFNEGMPLKQVFEDKGFEVVMMLEQVEENLDRLFKERGPFFCSLFILTGHSARDHAAILRKKIESLESFHIPTIYFPLLPPFKQLLTDLLERELDYFNHPFNLILIIEKITHPH